MVNPFDIVFLEDRPPVMVVSHSRAGTHFLMNSIAACYGYRSDPWIDFDVFHHNPLGGTKFAVNLETIYYCPQKIAEYLDELGKRPIATIVKSHYPADFFAGVIEKIVERFVIFVIHRHPADTLRSYWHFLLGIDEWTEGPKHDDVLDFAKAAPSGALMRYQMRQYPTMMHRWADHAEGWLAASKVSPRVVNVGFDELKSNFAGLMKSFASVLGREPQSVVPPTHDESTWIRSHLQQARSTPDMDALRALCRETIGATMDRLGYK